MNIDDNKHKERPRNRKLRYVADYKARKGVITVMETKKKSKLGYGVED